MNFLKMFAFKAHFCVITIGFLRSHLVYW